ncbi:MAG: hypothetical protein AVDCRST_MAG68-5240, partial [uncultured Gemmatimonadetes bacterium]
ETPPRFPFSRPFAPGLLHEHPPRIRRQQRRPRQRRARRRRRADHGGAEAARAQRSGRRGHGRRGHRDGERHRLHAQPLPRPLRRRGARGKHAHPDHHRALQRGDVHPEHRHAGLRRHTAGRAGRQLHPSRGARLPRHGLGDEDHHDAAGAGAL